tara:strand:+ start:808 stop:1323 length:516 start_codon:yes stop_codon:yes gene_type:complete
MIKKIHWIEKTKETWKLLLKIDNELYRIRIITKEEYGVKYSLYKYERFNEDDKEWTADVTKSKTTIKSRTPIIVLNAIRSIYLSHVEEYKPDNVVYTIEKEDGTPEKRIRIYTYFLNDLEKFGYRRISCNQFHYHTFIAVKKDSVLYAKPDNFFQMKFHQIQYKMDEINIP